jgi:hypothetical protein
MLDGVCDDAVWMYRLAGGLGVTTLYCFGKEGVAEAAERREVHIGANFRRPQMARSANVSNDLTCQELVETVVAYWKVYLAQPSAQTSRLIWPHAKPAAP